MIASLPWPAAVHASSFHHFISYRFIISSCRVLNLVAMLCVCVVPKFELWLDGLNVMP